MSIFSKHFQLHTFSWKNQLSSCSSQLSDHVPSYIDVIFLLWLRFVNTLQVSRISYRRGRSEKENGSTTARRGGRNSNKSSPSVFHKNSNLSITRAKKNPTRTETHRPPSRYPYFLNDPNGRRIRFSTNVTKEV